MSLNRNQLQGLIGSLPEAAIPLLLGLVSQACEKQDPAEYIARRIGAEEMHRETQELARKALKKLSKK